jgi:hypothetical protein
LPSWIGSNAYNGAHTGGKIRDGGLKSAAGSAGSEWSGLNKTSAQWTAPKPSPAHWGYVPDKRNTCILSVFCGDVLFSIARFSFDHIPLHGFF